MVFIFAVDCFTSFMVLFFTAECVALLFLAIVLFCCYTIERCVTFLLEEEVAFLWSATGSANTFAAIATFSDAETLVVDVELFSAYEAATTSWVVFVTVGFELILE